ncbi:bifunctional P-450/NADPH-P450 reductase [Paraphaeosphaeria sporulosa]
MTTPIPSPPALPLVGNLLNVTGAQPGESALKPFERLADEYGPIYCLWLGGSERIVVANYALFEELCDETRFLKTAGQALEGLNELRNTGARGMFTSPSEKDPDWGQAHRILMPAFGPLAIRDMFDEMHDIASQLALKWARLGSEYKIPVTEDFTRLTLDTIAICAMDYRFNSFYQDEMHPFVQAMIGVLSEGASRLKTPKLVQKFMYRRNEQLRIDSKYQMDVAIELVKRRREHPSEKKDLLNAMIHGKDPKTGEGMRDDLIAANMITFLVAGHETTSGLLSFAFYYLLKNPATYFKAQREVDNVVGQGKVTVDHMKQLHYIEAVLRETLRLEPTAPAFNTDPFPTIGGGKYALKKDSQVMCLLGKIQRDPAVYGEDANEFRPERMLDEHFNKLPKHAWKPFGTGMRGCIGRPFAWQEALLVMAILLQNFDFRLDDPRYDLKVKSALTVKPDGLFIRSSMRAGITASGLQERLSGSSDGSKPSPSPDDISKSLRGMHVSACSRRKMTILYGSNTGTCQAFAQKLASDAHARGFDAKVADMDSGVNSLPSSEPVVIITASYEGLAPDNATQFVSWLEFLDDVSALSGVQYSVFGCGHKDWSSTFHRIPKLVDSELEKLGATRIAERGSSDASQGDMFTDFETWEENTFWPAVTANFGAAPASAQPIRKGLDIEISTCARAVQLQQNVKNGSVLKAWVLTAPGESEKRHLDIKLPEGMTYSTGDYLTVLPLNPDASVHRVLKRFSIPGDAVITIKDGGPVTLPTDKPVSAYDLLKGFVELLQPATKKDLQICIEQTTDPQAIKSLDMLHTSLYHAEVLAKRISLLDLLEAHPAISLPFATFLSQMPPMRSRHYSISSSPLRDPSVCSITYGVLNTTSLAGTSHFQGVAGTYLSSLGPGDAIQINVRPAPPAFHLPASPTIPILMFCNGTGLAPFRGFIQERATMLSANPDARLAPALLFIGCRSPTTDALYYSEFAQWAKMGAVDVRYAYSREWGHADAQGCKYVQDRMWKDSNDVSEMWRAGAKVFLCGGPGMVEGIKVSAKRIVENSMGSVDDEEVENWFKGLRNERIVVDVFA